MILNNLLQHLFLSAKHEKTIFKGEVRHSYYPVGKEAHD
jgi:hypothetical protein